jgi:hypothetical protein
MVDRTASDRRPPRYRHAQEVALIDGALSDLIPVDDLVMLAIDGQTSSGLVIEFGRVHSGTVGNGAVRRVRAVPGRDATPGGGSRLRPGRSRERGDAAPLGAISPADDEVGRHGGATRRRDE